MAGPGDSESSRIVDRCRGGYRSFHRRTKVGFAKRCFFAKLVVGNRSYQEISNVVNKFNEMIRHKVLYVDSEEKRVLAEKLVNIMEDRLAEATAVDCSRIAWLCLNMQDEERAIRFTSIGFDRDPTNEYCLGLKVRLDRRDALPMY